MQDRPDLAELLESVRHFLEEEILPAAEDPRLRFRTRVAANVLAIAGRELSLGPALLEAELERLRALLPDVDPVAAAPREAVERLNGELARRIREGELDASPGGPVWDHLRRTAVEKLRIANPGYLRRAGERG
ncbi:MAG: hypothetical protein HY721_21185 [Planctomycetes bacterium]|nr:hypothetical protein [Planctomycetota bacterium]